MFKKLLTTMLVMALAVTAGSTIAGDAPFTVYGKLHSSMNMLNNGDESQLDLTSNTSRFGLRGHNPLNDNFTLIWQFESKLDMSEKSGTSLATRNTYIGFKHAEYGQVRMGIHDTPFKTLGRKVEMFPDELGDFRQLTSRGPAASFDYSGNGISDSEYRFSDWDNRLSNILAWVSPDWDGFGVFLAYMFDQGDKLSHSDISKGYDFAGNYASETAFSGMASYNKDEIFVGVAFEKLSEGWAPYHTGTDGDFTYGDAPSAMRIAGKYTAEKFVIGGLYQGVSSQATDINDTFEDINGTTMGVNAKFMAAPKWAIKGSFFTTNEFTDAEDDPDSADFDESDTKANLIALGVDHLVNKNVKVYLQWAQMSNGDMTDVHLGGAQSGFGDAVSGAPVMEGDPPVMVGTYENPSGFSAGAVVTW